MNRLPEKPTSHTEDVDLRRALGQAGWRYTRQRAAVHQHLQRFTCHPTAEQIFQAVRQQIANISLATVYKALEALVDAGLATRMSGGPGPARYDGRSDAHYHLRCERTGQVRDLPLPYNPDLLLHLAPDLIDRLRQQGFEVTGHRLELVGRFHSGQCSGKDCPLPADCTSPERGENGGEEDSILVLGPCPMDDSSSLGGHN